MNGKTHTLYFYVPGFISATFLKRVTRFLCLIITLNIIIGFGLTALASAAGATDQKRKDDEVDTPHLDSGPPYFTGAIIVGAMTLISVIISIVACRFDYPDMYHSKELKTFRCLVYVAMAECILKLIGSSIGVLFCATYGLRDCYPGQVEEFCTYIGNKTNQDTDYSSKRHTFSILIIVLIVLSAVSSSVLLYKFCQVGHKLGIRFCKKNILKDDTKYSTNNGDQSDNSSHSIVSDSSDGSPNIDLRRQRYQLHTGNTKRTRTRDRNVPDAIHGHPVTDTGMRYSESRELSMAMPTPPPGRGRTQAVLNDRPRPAPESRGFFMATTPPRDRRTQALLMGRPNDGMTPFVVTTPAPVVHLHTHAPRSSGRVRSALDVLQEQNRLLLEQIKLQCKQIALQQQIKEPIKRGQAHTNAPPMFTEEPPPYVETLPNDVAIQKLDDYNRWLLEQYQYQDVKLKKGRGSSTNQPEVPSAPTGYSEHGNVRLWDNQCAHVAM